MTKDFTMIRVQAFISQYHRDKLGYYCVDKSLPMSRLIAIAIDNELEKEKPFNFPLDLPTQEYIEYAYVDEASKILAYMQKQNTGMTLDMLMILRHDIGIKDKETFLAAFRECLEKKMLEEYHQLKNNYAIDDYVDTTYYRVVGTGPKDTKVLRGKTTKYDRYLKLKKTFESIK